MVANDDSESMPSDEGDALDEVALASVNQALEAVENEEVVEEVDQEEESPQPPRNVIPELEDVEDPEEMVPVLLTVGEERSRRGDVKGSLAAFNKPLPSTHRATWHGSTEAFCSKPNRTPVGRASRSKFAWI